MGFFLGRATMGGGGSLVLLLRNATGETLLYGDKRTEFCKKKKKKACKQKNITKDMAQAKKKRRTGIP